MDTFIIEVTELLSREIEIKANDANSAIEKIENLYRNEEIVLDYSDFAYVDFKDKKSRDEKDVLIKEVIDYLIIDEKKHFEKSDKKDEIHIYQKLERLKSLISY